MNILTLAPGKEKSLLRRHPWLYSNAIERAEGSLASGATVLVRAHNGRFLARASFSPVSAIRARGLIARHAMGREVLNCFCYTGGFSLAALKGGARHVVSIDSSGEALTHAQANILANGFDPALARWLDADAFKALRSLHDDGERFDLVVLDPPKFASSQHHIERAARAYKDINLSGFKLLRPGGLLATYSCSGAVDAPLFQKIVASAAADAGVDVRILGRLGAGADHPLLTAFPEGEYLKGLWIQRI